MHELLQRLGRGDTRIMDMCTRSHRAWVDFFAELEGCDVGTLAARLSFFQRDIVKLFDSPKLGESMMAWGAFSSLFDTDAGWGHNEQRARELVQAFAMSNCTAEVKSEARSAAISYELEGGAPASHATQPANDRRDASSSIWLRTR